MSGARQKCADVFPGLRQVDAHNSVVAQENLFDPKYRSRYDAKGREKKGPAALRELNGPLFRLPIDPHANVREHPGRESLAKLLNEILLSAVDHWPRSVTYEQRVRSSLHCLQHGSERVDAARKQHYHVYRRQLADRLLKLKDFLCGSVSMSLDEIKGKIIAG
jgi:hypothetical protein